MLPGAIFDMDGLLLDTERLYEKAWRNAAKAFGQEHSKEFHRNVCGTNGEKMLQVIAKYYPKVDNVEFMHYCLNNFQEMIQEDVPEKAGMRQILNYFQENGVKMAVASSSAPEVIASNLGRLDVLKYFTAVVSGHQVAKGKPAPDIFLLAAQKLELAPKDCYVFEDSGNGIRAGAAAGCRTIMIPDLIPPTEELCQLSDGVYGSLSDFVTASTRGEI